MPTIGRQIPEPIRIDLLQGERGSPDAGIAVRSVTGNNLGVGSPLFRGWNGYPDVVLDFKSLLAGPGIEFVEGADSLVIRSTDGLQLVAGPGVVITDTTTTRSISIDPNAITARGATIRLNYTASGELASSSTFTGVPPGWTLVRDAADAFTVIYPDAAAPMVTVYAFVNDAYVPVALPAFGMALMEDLQSFTLSGLTGDAVGLLTGLPGHALLKIVF